MAGIKMAEDSRIPAIPPSVMWAQRDDKLYVTINLEDCKEPTIKLEETKLYFKGKGGPEQKEYEITMEFFKEINPEESKYVVFQRNIPMVLKKKDDGPYWARMLKVKNKQHWLKTDFNKWRDEDDSDTEGGNEMQLEDMMKQMGNFNTADTGGAEMVGNEEEDSDDEDLPDLE